jgi:glutathione S-transferase
MKLYGFPPTLSIRVLWTLRELDVEKRLTAEIPIARQDFLEMAAVLEKHMEGRQFLVGDNVTATDFVAAYTLDMASVVPSAANEGKLLDDFPRFRGFMDRMYKRPKAPPRIAEAFASLGRDNRQARK